MGRIPNKEWDHDPYLLDKYNNTVGMMLAKNGIIPPH